MSSERAKSVEYGPARQGAARCALLLSRLCCWPRGCTCALPQSPPASCHAFQTSNVCRTTQGAKIGVLGANGAGKTSLMRILAGTDTSFDGRVVRAPGIRCAPRLAGLVTGGPCARCFEHSPQLTQQPQSCPPTAGAVCLCPAAPPCRVGYLEQEPSLDAGATVAENIAPAVQHIKCACAFLAALACFACWTPLGRAGAGSAATSTTRSWASRAHTFSCTAAAPARQGHGR